MILILELFLDIGDVGDAIDGDGRELGEFDYFRGW